MALLGILALKCASRSLKTARDAELSLSSFSALHKMRIAMFSWESLHSITVGGVAPHVTELAAALQRRDHEAKALKRMKSEGFKEELGKNTKEHTVILRYFKERSSLRSLSIIS